MTETCQECSIRYASELPACPWCGHAREAAPAAISPTEAAGSPGADLSEPEAPRQHIESRNVPPPPPPPPPSPSVSGSVTYDLADIPGPDEDWEPIDQWIADEGEPMDRPAATQRVKRWALIAVGSVALLAFGAFLAEVVPVGIGGGTDAATLPEPVAPTATAAVPTTSPPPTTAAPPQTTVVATTTRVLEAIGEPLAPGDLRLFETGFGDLTFGSDGELAVGRLVATYGQPDLDETGPAAGGDSGGFCEGEVQRRIRWGSLTVFNEINADGTQSLASIQLSATEATGPDPAAQLDTLSGLQLGDTMATLRGLYDGFRIDEFPDSGGGVWEIRAGSDGRLLLWGTNSGSGGGSDEDLVTSIRSALRCDA